MKVLIVYYSTYGNVFQMAQLVAEGVGEVPGAQPVIRTVPELIPESVIQSRADMKAGRDMQKDVPLVTLDDPYSVSELFTAQGGGSPYGPGHLAGGDNRRAIDPQEAAICRALGRRLADIGSKLQRT
jgi:multimeric flavodoxin WrbA